MCRPAQSTMCSNKATTLSSGGPMPDVDDAPNETHLRSRGGAGSTTGAGAPSPSDRNSLTIGPDGPILLHDVHFLEQMAHFNREKVPERQPHAKGARRVRRLRDHRGRLAVHQGGTVPAGRIHRDAGPLLDRGRRDGQSRHMARRARLLAQVLHRRGQLRPRRQQHADVLRSRSDEVPALHPQPEAAAPTRAFATTTCSGTSGPKPRVRASSHLPDG